MSLSADQTARLQYLMTLGVRRAAGELHDMLAMTIVLEVPRLTCLTAEELSHAQCGIDETRLATVHLGFTKPWEGRATLAMAPASAAMLVAALVSEAPVASDLDAISTGTFSEVGTLILSGVISILFKRSAMDFSLQAFQEETFSSLMQHHILESEATLLVVQFCYHVEQINGTGNLIFLFRNETWQALLASIDPLRPELEKAL
jgi:hypothetical protein